MAFDYPEVDESHETSGYSIRHIFLARFVSTFFMAQPGKRVTKSAHSGVFYGDFFFNRNDLIRLAKLNAFLFYHCA